MNKYKLEGFTLIELLVGTLISSILAIALLNGVMYVQSSLHKIRIKERAYEELKGYNDFWKGKISANDIAESGNLSYTKPMCLDLTLSDDGSCVNDATLFADIILIDTGNSHAKRKGLKTRIEWETVSGVELNIEFYSEQMVFE